MKLKKRFWIGVVLLLVNSPIGWGGMLICNTIALNKHDSFYSVLGVIIYIISWVMLGLGFLLAGPEGIKFYKFLINKIKCFCLLLFNQFFSL